VIDVAEKPKIAFYWCASCGGCEESLVDLAEDLLKVIELVDIVFSPVAVDFKKEDVENMPDKSITAALINGAVRTSEQKEMSELLRRKSQFVIAYGACSQYGGIPGLANLSNKETIMNYVYKEAPTDVNPEGTFPQESYTDEEGRDLTLPRFYNTVRALDQVIDVDYYIPGCPPTPKLLFEAVQALLSGNLPPKGTVLAPDVALCEECPRKDSKPEKLLITRFYRPHEIVADPEKCFLAQGIPCMGIATRKGCESLCIKANMPCTGCFGATSRISDYGAKLLSAISSEVDSTDEKEIEGILAGIPDPVGTFYRYSLPASLLRRTINDKGGE
jgi:F420-non-reducing hydrogenase small subunit